jgi:hypothetical protein
LLPPTKNEKQKIYNASQKLNRLHTDRQNLTVKRLTYLHLDKTEKRTTAYNSTYPKGGVSCSKDGFVVNGSLVFQIKFCGKSPALRVAAERWQQV